MNCIDGMVWIGESYSRILCKSKNSCAVPFRKDPPHCYVHEAQWRGCCRKIPNVPNWVIPGRTRIFLAHKDNLKKIDQGKIFGYFVLKQIEIIEPSDRPLPFPLQNLRKVEDRDGKRRTGQCWNGSKVITHHWVDGKWVATNEKCPDLPPQPECKNGQERTKRCDDDSTITTHICKGGIWVPTNDKCPEDNGLDSECEDGDVRLKGVGMVQSFLTFV